MKRSPFRLSFLLAKRCRVAQISSLCDVLREVFFECEDTPLSNPSARCAALARTAWRTAGCLLCRTTKALLWRTCASRAKKLTLTISLRSEGVTEKTKKSPPLLSFQLELLASFLRSEILAVNSDHRILQPFDCASAGCLIQRRPDSSDRSSVTTRDWRQGGNFGGRLVVPLFVLTRRSNSCFQ